MRNLGAYLTVYLLCSAAFKTVKAESKHMVCKTVDDIFDESSEQGASSASGGRAQGPPGKRGPQGVRGPPGLKGQRGHNGAPGSLDFEKINATVKEIVYSAIREMEITSEERIYDRLREEADNRECPGIVYKQKCYWGVIHNSVDVNFEQAKQYCRQQSGYPADFIDSQHYSILTEYVRSSIPSSTHRVYLWIGMTYNHGTKSLQLSNGSNAPYETWFPGFPTAKVANTGMGFQVDRDVNSKNQGMFNYLLTTPQHGVLCEI